MQGYNEKSENDKGVSGTLSDYYQTTKTLQTFEGEVFEKDNKLMSSPPRSFDTRKHSAAAIQTPVLRSG